MNLKQGEMWEELRGEERRGKWGRTRIRKTLMLARGNRKRREVEEEVGRGWTVRRGKGRR